MPRIIALKTIWGDDPERLIPAGTETNYCASDLKERIALGQIELAKAGSRDEDDGLDGDELDEAPPPPARSHKKKR